jgi:hypothetical protein
MVDEIDPRQPFLWVHILRWREIFRMIETRSSNVDLIGAFVVLIDGGNTWHQKQLTAATNNIVALDAKTAVCARTAAARFTSSGKAVILARDRIPFSWRVRSTAATDSSDRALLRPSRSADRLIQLAALPAA